MDDFERAFNVNVTIRVTVRDDGDTTFDNVKDKVNYLLQTLDYRVDDYEINDIEER